ncbi:MAG: hypothetical protein R3E98_09060 [Gemmatimonadota bacterium]
MSDVDALTGLPVADGSSRSSTEGPPPLVLQPSTQALLETDPGAIYGRAVLAHLPRMLSQIDRNPASPTYGCCCRNFWHYRIEDIPNSQLQEVVLTLAGAYALERDWNPWAGSPQLLRWIEAVLLYWTRIQRPSGCFDEVYRGQDSYAATAFSTYCSTEAALLLRDRLAPDVVTAVTQAARRAVDWLGATQEELACNQVAGAAGAALNTARLTGEARYEAVARQAIDTLAEAQSTEGWFNEYGGADIGYSSLTVDYLARVWRRTGWEDAGAMAVRLVEFLQYFVHRDGTAGGVHGSRNTEYLIPHGLELLAPDHAPSRELSTLLLRSLAEHPERSVLARLDDRYLCYLSGFFLQAAADAAPRAVSDLRLPCTRMHDRFFPEAGLWSRATEWYHLVANLRKGGVLRCDFHDGPSFQDSGLFVTSDDGTVHTTQALQPARAAHLDISRATVEAPLMRLRPITVSPVKVVLFKTWNLAVPARLRRWVLDALRGRAVSAGAPLANTVRTIDASCRQIFVEDRLDLPTGRFRVRSAALTERAFSFASAGFFHPSEVEQVTSLPAETAASGPLTLRRTLAADGWSASEPAPAGEGHV